MFFKLQRINDSLMICAEPDNLTVGDFISVGFVLLKCAASNNTEVQLSSWLYLAKVRWRLFILGMPK